MELSFEFNEGAKFKNGKILIDDLKIINDSIEYGSLEVYLDGEKYTGGINTFAENNVSADWLFNSILNAYLRNDTSGYKSFSEDWSVFKSLESKKEYKDDLVVKLPIYNYDEVEVYDLDLATKQFRYYSCVDRFIMLDLEGKVITDIEAFYTNAMWEDLAKHLLGIEPALYLGYNAEEAIKECRAEILDSYRQ